MLNDVPAHLLFITFIIFRFRKKAHARLGACLPLHKYIHGITHGLFSFFFFYCHLLIILYVRLFCDICLHVHV